MAKFKQTPETLFALVTGPQEWRGVTKVSLPASGAAVAWVEQSGRHSITYQQVASDPPRLFRTRIADASLPFGGTWTWEIAPADGGCTCRITEDGEVYNPVFRFVSRFIMGYTKSIDDYLNAMGKKFNEPVNIDP
jgi:hypothetical protein